MHDIFPRRDSQLSILVKRQLVDEVASYDVSGGDGAIQVSEGGEARRGGETYDDFLAVLLLQSPDHILCTVGAGIVNDHYFVLHSTAQQALPCLNI